MEGTTKRMGTLDAAHGTVIELVKRLIPHTRGHLRGYAASEVKGCR